MPKGLIVRIEGWSVGHMAVDFYEAPEMQDIVLRGRVFGHPNWPQPEGHELRTSPIILVTKREVLTYSGTVYVLGTPDPGYVEWCIDNNMHDPTVDVDEPIVWTAGVANG